MDRFDLIVLGGGPAGYLAAERAAQGGMSAAVIEKRALGGVCLNEGCIPSKALLNSAKIYYSASHGEKYGVTAQDVRMNHAIVLARKNKVVKTLVAGVGFKMKKAGVRVIKAEGKICGTAEGGGFIVEAQEEKYIASNLLIASGSSPALPPIAGLREGIESGFCLTNREILDLSEVPNRLVVVGGGVIGLEMASYFAAAGAEVTVVEMLEKIAGGTDVKISEILQKELKNKGIVFRLGCKVTKIGTQSIVFEEGGERMEIPADKVLISIGRKPFTEGLGLDKIGVILERGAVVTDEKMRTNVSGVYAAGDVNGKAMLAHAAYRESEVAVNTMLGIEDEMNYTAVPAVIYTSPEVACVGETLESARQKGCDAQEVSLPMNMSGRYVAETERGSGIAKMVVDKPSGTVIGVHLIGSYVSEMIYGAAAMVGSKAKAEDLKRIIFPHPTVSEVLRELLFEI